MDTDPPKVLEIIPDGDALVMLDGLPDVVESPVGILVSSHALALTSPVFTAKLDAVRPNHPSLPGPIHPLYAIPGLQTPVAPFVIGCPGDDGTAMFLLIFILHMRNDRLPPHVTPQTLFDLALLAARYECVIAAVAGTRQWFDHIFSSDPHADLWPVIQAAYLLDEPTYFARFTARWILAQSLDGCESLVAQAPNTVDLAKALETVFLHKVMSLQTDIAELVDPCAYFLSEPAQHDVEQKKKAANAQPKPCRSDSDGAGKFLGALRDKAIWPTTTWSGETADGEEVSASIEDIQRRLRSFRPPVYDDSDQCRTCEGVVQVFSYALKKACAAQDRFWGLCLDCFKAGGVNPGQCRSAHGKPRPEQKLIEQHPAGNADADVDADDGLDTYRPTVGFSE